MRDTIHRFLTDPQNKLAVFSSIASTGPQSALVGIAVTPDFEVVFDTVKHSRKYPNLLADPRCSLVIGTTTGTTVQYEGIAREVTDAAELARLKETYFAAFPDGPSREEWPGIVYIAVKPNWLRYCDYGETPPVIETLTF